MSGFIIELIQRGIWSLPYLLVWGIGFGICIHFRSKNKSATNMAITAFSIFIVNLILSTVIQTWLISSQGQDSTLSLHTSFMIAGGVNAVMNIAGWIFLLIALYQLLDLKPVAN
ncbi:MAG: hypothetical protein IPK77_15845 [Cellvibrio sp.]|nr:hypothetical protein [Cellvibrio sp.]